MPPNLLVPREFLDLEDRAAGRWLRAVDMGSGVEVQVGKIGMRGGWTTRSRLRGWRIGRMGHHVEILMTYPIHELATTRISQATEQLADDVRRAGGQGAELDALREAVGRVLEVDSETGPLSSVLTEAAFPLLRPALDAGRDVREVPEVLVPLLRAGDVRSGTRAMFGRVTRPLIRAVARRPHPDHGPVFPPLVVAAMAAGACGPERLTEIIDTDPVDPSTLAFTIPDVVRARLMFAAVSPRRVSDTLTGVLADPTLRDEFGAEIAAWHPPLPERRPRAEPQPAPEPGRPDPQPERHRQQRVQALTARPPRIDYPPAWRAAEGATVGGHVVALPRDADDLRHWGQVLNNCLGGFGDAAAAGASRLIGLTRSRQLRYVAEITPGGVIRQIEGTGNRRPNRQLGNELARQIIALGLANSDGRTGQSLVAPRLR